MCCRKVGTYSVVVRATVLGCWYLPTCNGFNGHGYKQRRRSTDSVKARSALSTSFCLLLFPCFAVPVLADCFELELWIRVVLLRALRDISLMRRQLQY